jgi:hypothetical protein
MRPVHYAAFGFGFGFDDGSGGLTILGRGFDAGGRGLTIESGPGENGLKL